MNRFADQLIYVTRKSFTTVRRLGRLFSTILVLSLIAIWLLFASILYESYENEWSSAALFVSNVDSLIEQDISRTIEFYDLSLKSAAASFADPDTMRLPPKLRRRVIFDQSANASDLGAILLLDKSGRAIADSRFEPPRPFDATDSDYFKVQVDGQVEHRLFISHPFQSTMQRGMWAIGLSRRLENPDGSFAGVVLGTIRLSYFSRLFGAVALPEGSAIAIVHDDGTILMRSPFLEIGGNLKNSDIFKQGIGGDKVVYGKSTLDQVERLYAFKRIGQLPISLSVGIPSKHFLGSWRWRVAFVAFGFFILSSLILVLAITLGRELHRRTLAEQTLLELASTDGLTNLANRRRLDETLEYEWRRAIRDGTSIALLMVDGDFFKAYNDTYGHVQGDQALRMLADALRDSVQRPTDLVARFGGEEFAILLPGTDLDGAIQVGERVLASVARLECAHAGSPFGRLTVSIGVAACLATETGIALSLIQAADFALYEAKENGRNQIATGERLDLTRFGWRAAANS